MMHEMDGCTPECAGEHVTLLGGPLDGHLLPVDNWPADRRLTGVAHIVPGETYRACYAAPPGEPMAAVWPYEGDMG